MSTPRNLKTACLWLLFLLLTLALCGRAARRPFWYDEILQEQYPLGPELSVISQAGRGNEPVVMSSGAGFLRADYYATPGMAARLVSVADRQLAKQMIGTDGVDSALLLGREYLRLHGRIVSFAELKSADRSFWLIGDATDPINWISEKPRADGADIRALNVPNMRIFHVTLP